MTKFKVGDMVIVKEFGEWLGTILIVNDKYNGYFIEKFNDKNCGYWITENEVVRRAERGEYLKYL